MYKTVKLLLVGSILVFAGLNGLAQTGKKPVPAAGYQGALMKLEREVFTAGDNQLRFSKNAEFVKALVSALKRPRSFNLGFDSLQSISHVFSPDKTFRVFSWFVPTDEGTYRYFGAIQMQAADGSLKLFPLVDATENLKDNNAVTDNKNWLGSRYYEIIPLMNAGNPVCYALLGWKGNNAKTSKKVIEILSFEHGEPVFGKPVIEATKNGPLKNRMVYEYNKLNSMTLTWDKGAAMIVLDHLAPINPDMVGNFEYYASDLSFDAYKPVGGKLKLLENVELKNDPKPQDDFYIDPKRKDIPTTKKF